MQAQRPGDILLIDPDPAFLGSVASALRHHGHTVTTCENGAQARYYLERTNFNVVLLAHRLPDEDGAALCHVIKTQTELLTIAVALLVDDLQQYESTFYHDDRGGLGYRAEGQTNLVPPDELIRRSLHHSEWSGRVQSLLRLGRYQEEIYNSIGTLMNVAAGVEEQDKRVGGHCRRLSIMAVELGAVLGCDEFQLTALERAGYLHDIGKVSIPGGLMEKSERLSPREMEIIQSHCVLGERLCQDIAALKPVLPIIRHHHERADGTGYPDRLRGEDIPILAQIFSIPDIYDALRMWRPYRPPMHEAQAIDIIRQEVARGYWNRLIFDAFAEKVLPGLDDRLDAAHALWPKG